MFFFLFFFSTPNARTVQSTGTGTLRFPHRRRSDLTKPNEQERITVGWIISEVENQPRFVPRRCKSHLDRVCVEKIGPLRAVTLALQPTRGTSPPAMRLKDLSDSRWGLKGDEISHIISWEHQGCMAEWALLAWFITLPVIFLFWWMANRTDMEFLFVKQRCVCGGGGIVTVVHSRTFTYCKPACNPRALMICMCHCCVFH